MIAVDSQSARCSMAPSTANPWSSAAAAGAGPGIRPAYVAWAPVGVVMAAILAAPPADVYGTLARSAQLAELVGRGLVGWQQHGEVLLLVAGSGERDDVEAERSRGRVLVTLAVAAESRGRVLLPELGELGAGGGEGGDELGAAGIAGVLGQARAKLSDELAGFLGPVDDQGAGRIGGEEQPQHVALAGRAGVKAAVQERVGLVVGEQVPPGIGDEGGTGVKGLNETPQGVIDFRRPDGPGRQGEARHGEQVLALGRGHPQHARQALDHLAAGADVTALLEPGVPGDADPGQLCQFLPAQTGGPPPGPRPQADADRVGGLAP